MWSLTASAGAAEVALSVSDCSLRESELSRLVTLELSGVLDSSDRDSRYQVLVRCDPTGVSIQLHDPLTRKQVQRRVVAPAADQPEPERVIALTVAQLYRAAWLELVSDDVAPLEPASPEAPRASLAAARALAERGLTDRSEPVWMFGLAAGAKFRHITAPVTLAHGELRVVNLSASPLLFSASANLEASSTQRRAGVVQARLFGAALGAGFELFRRQSWSTFSEMSLGLAHVRLQGSEVNAAYEAGTVSSLGLDAAVGLGMAWSNRKLRIELAGRAGVLSGAPVGLVAPHGDVSLNGAWLGADLRFGVLR